MNQSEFFKNILASNHGFMWIPGSSADKRIWLQVRHPGLGRIPGRGMATPPVTLSGRLQSTRLQESGTTQAPKHSTQAMAPQILDTVI